MNESELEEYLLYKYQFFSLIGDTIISFENGAFSCASFMSFVLIDILTSFSNKGKTNRTLYAKFIKEYFSIFNEEYKDDIKSNSMYDFRSSFVHNFALNMKSRKNKIIPYISYDDFPKNHLTYDKNGKLKIFLPILISELIIVSEYLFENTIKTKFNDYRLTLSNNFIFVSMNNSFHEQLIIQRKRINFEKSIHKYLAPLNGDEDFKSKFTKIKTNLLTSAQKIFNPPLSPEQIKDFNENLKPFDLNNIEY